MSYSNKKIASTADVLKKHLAKADNKAAILRAPELKALAAEIPSLEPKDRAGFGQQLNKLKAELEQLVAEAGDAEESLPPIDVTAPMDVNAGRPKLLSAEKGGRHPLLADQDELIDIFGRMSFEAVESRQLDDDYHMFSSLNFPKGHPARDDYDTFTTTEGLIAPAHTSTMQNRVLLQHKKALQQGKAIAVVIAGRVYRNEDIDARHEHTFQQIEGIYVDKGIHAGHLIATLHKFLEEYYGKSLEVRTQPFYFPFTEPSFEFAMSCPFCDKLGCKVCSQSGWIEILGCGMIHPNVLKEAGIDPRVYTGFAWGVGTMRLAMMKHGIEDIRLFNSGKLEFLRQFR